jgi:hypothetical protein
MKKYQKQSLIVLSSLMNYDPHPIQSYIIIYIFEEASAQLQGNSQEKKLKAGSGIIHFLLKQNIYLNHGHAHLKCTHVHRKLRHLKPSGYTVYRTSSKHTLKNKHTLIDSQVNRF